MSINLALILVLLTGFSGIVVLFNRLWYQAKAESGEGNSAIDTLVEYSRSFFPVLLFVVGLTSLARLPFDAFPDTTPVQVTVNAVAPNRPASCAALASSCTRTSETSCPNADDMPAFTPPSRGFPAVSRVCIDCGSSILAEGDA